MGMRTDCKHYESRSYANGETVRKCRLDLAPGRAVWAMVKSMAFGPAGPGDRAP